MGKNDLSEIREEMDAWSEWMQAVPQEERDTVVELLTDHDVSSNEGMLMFLRRLYLEVISGRLPKPTIMAALPILDRMLTLLFRMQETHGPIAGTFMTRTLQETFQAIPSAEPRYISTSQVRPEVEQEHDVINADEH